MVIEKLRGAEATLSRSTVIGRKVVVKTRSPKQYRNQKLDARLRRERTRYEARLLNKAKLAGVDCPTVLQVDEFAITMEFVEGKRPQMNRKEDASEAGTILAKLHQNDIIHGDYTPANLIRNGTHLLVIDFGLGFVSNDVEDKAVDVFTMLRAIGNQDDKSTKAKQAFVDGYAKNYPKADSVLERVKKVEKRVRYAD